MLRVHVQFFARDGHAIFSNFVASPAHNENRKCSHTWTADATNEKIARNSTKSISHDFFSTAFFAVASPVQEWLQLRFSSRASDATKLEKFASLAWAENRSCGRGFRITIFRFKALLHCEMLSSSIFVSVRTNSNRNFVVRFANFHPAFEFSCGSVKFLWNFSGKITPFPPKFQENNNRNLTKFVSILFAQYCRYSCHNLGVNGFPGHTVIVRKSVDCYFDFTIIINLSRQSEVHFRLLTCPSWTTILQTLHSSRWSIFIKVIQTLPPLPIKCVT